MNENLLLWAGSVCMAVVVVVGHFAPWWLVAVMAAGWLFNAVIYWRRGKRLR